jgi:transposase
MMGFKESPQGKLFYTSINLEQRIRSNHPLRKIAELIDFDFVYREFADKYGRNGNVSVPPPLILKLLVLLVFYNVRSERDVYICPTGQELKRKSLHLKRQSIDYAAPKKVCLACVLRDQCTRNKTG